MATDLQVDGRGRRGCWRRFGGGCVGVWSGKVNELNSEIRSVNYGIQFKSVISGSVSHSPNGLGVHDIGFSDPTNEVHFVEVGPEPHCMAISGTAVRYAGQLPFKPKWVQMARGVRSGADNGRMDVQLGKQQMVELEDNIQEAKKDKFAVLEPGEQAR